MRIFFAVIFSFSTFIAFGQDYSQDSAWICDNYYKIERYIKMRDGIRLFTSIYIPKDSTEKHPILMKRTPYSCAPYGEDKFISFWDSYLRYYLREGYIMVFQDVRGRWMSEGDFVDIRPFIKEKKSNKDIDESSDTFDSIDWLINNIPHNNGRVGVFGISYPGFYSTMAAASAHPALKAVSPQAPVTDWFRGDDFHHNGAFFIMDAFSFYAGEFGLPRPKPTTTRPSGFDFPVKDNYKFFLQTGALKNFMKLTGDSISFWKDLYAHPNEDDWWRSRNARVSMYNVKPAMMVVGGEFDAEDCFGAWNLYKAIKKQSPQTTSHLVMGPLYHEEWSYDDGTHLGNIQFGSNTSIWYQNNLEIPFFNHYLKGKEDPHLSAATIFFTGENKWRKFDQWPPAAVEERAIYLKDNDGLSWNKPEVTNSFSEYTSDPAHPVPYAEEVHFNRTREYMTDDQRFASRRPDVLTFQTDLLKEDLTLAGPVIVDLAVSITTTDADFMVKLIDVFPDSLSYNKVDIYDVRDPVKIYPMGGYEMLVHGEIMRGKFRNSYEKPEPFRPNTLDKIHYAIPDVAHTFKKGHRLMIQIQSSWFPLVDRNPQKFVNIYEADDSDFQKSTIRIYHETEHASSIVLPILK
jgi:putative CocE/NonD family hydrolase